MILAFIAQIALAVTSNDFNENLMQVLQDSHHTSLFVGEVGNIDANNNQILVQQNNTNLDLAQIQGADIELIYIIATENTEYHNMFINRYSDFAVNYQLLTVNVIQSLNDIYNQYLNDPNSQQINDSCLSQLNIVYGQYLADSNSLYLDGSNVDEMVNAFNGINEGLNISYLDHLTTLYYDIVYNLFNNCCARRHLDCIYSQYLNSLRNNLPVDVVDIQITNEYNNQILNFLNRIFISELNNQLVLASTNIQSMYNICMENFITAYKKYLLDVRKHMTFLVDREYNDSNYINYFSTVYNKFLNDLNNHHIQATQEPISRMNNLYQSTLYKTYLRNINNIYYGKYLQRISLSYNSYIEVFINGNTNINNDDLDIFNE